MIKRYVFNQIKRNFSISLIWINGGSDMDINGKKGINHILCSLLTRGSEGFNNLALSDFIEFHGGELNHEVFEDGMFISIKSLNVYFDELLPLVELIVNKPILSERQFRQVKNLTLNSIKKEKENPFNICYERWKKIVYLKHPYAFNIMGNENDIANISYEDILSEYEKFKSRKKYLISNKPIIKKENSEIYYQNISNRKSIKQKYDLNKENRFVSYSCESNQTILMLGNQTCSRSSVEYLPLKVLESHLSYGMSSVLFKLFREKNGITYDVGVLNSVRREKAPFLIYLSVSNENAFLAFHLLSTLWKKILFSLITDDEIKLAKEKLKGSFLISNQSLEDVFQRKGQLISYGISPGSSKDYLSKIEAVTSEDILKVANKYLANPFLSVTGSKNICYTIKDKWISIS